MECVYFWGGEQKRNKKKTQTRKRGKMCVYCRWCFVIVIPSNQGEIAQLHLIRKRILCFWIVIIMSSSTMDLDIDKQYLSAVYDFALKQFLCVTLKMRVCIGYVFSHHFILILAPYTLCSVYIPFSCSCKTFIVVWWFDRVRFESNFVRCNNVINDKFHWHSIVSRSENNKMCMIDISSVCLCASQDY